MTESLTKTNDNPIFYILINSDLEMSRGQINAQIVHITQIIVEECVKMCYEQAEQSEQLINYLKWKSNPTTVILKAPESELLKFSKNTNCKGFYDSGNKIKKLSLTVIGFFPDTKLDFSNYKLF